MAQQVLPDLSAIKPGAMAAFTIDGTRVAVANADGALFAFDDTCPHRHCSLATGVLSGTSVTCRCHGSQFDVRTGKLLRGPATQSIGTYQVDAEGAVHVDN